MAFSKYCFPLSMFIALMLLSSTDMSLAAYQSTVKQLKPRLKQVNNDERLDHQNIQDTDQMDQ